MAGGVQMLGDRPPTRLSINVETPDGHLARWADDGRPGDVPNGLTFSTTMPGGFEQCSLALDRDPRRAYSDLELLAEIVIRGPGGRIVWEGRMDTIPDTSGSTQEKISPTFVGHQQHLQDNNSAKEIYLDVDQTQWQGPTIQRQINDIASSVDVDGPSTSADPGTALPALDVGFDGSWGRVHVCEAWYDAQGIALGALYYAWKLNGAIASGDPNWIWQAYLSTDDVASGVDTTGNLRAAGPGTGSLAATTATRKWALLLSEYAVAAGVDGTHYGVLWTFVGVVGNHGLPVQGTLGAGGGIGFLASDVVAHAVSKYAPELNYSTGPLGTIRPSGFVLPQLAFKDPTTASDIVTQTSAYELPDWAVWNRKTFYWAPRDTFGKRWQVRVDDADLQETGEQSSRLFNGVMVSYTDVTGLTRTVGPPGSGANVEDGSLIDGTTSNPCNQVTVDGQPLRKWGLLQMGTVSTPPGAIQIGQKWLQEQRLIDRSGQATINGWIQDDSGSWWPACMVRAGDLIRFVDASNSDYRRIVRTDYTHDSRTNQIQLDAPPDGMAELLARMAVVISGLGFGLA